MKVHSAVGPGLDEEIYHQELVAALTAAGISHLSKPRRDLGYRGMVADTFEPDFVVEDHFIPELKCLRGAFAPEHWVQVVCYCKFWRLRTSLLVDFGKQSLMWERFLYLSHTASLPEVNVPDFVTNSSLATTIVRAVAECLNEIGLGYRQTTWKGLVSAAIQSAGMKVHLNPTALTDGINPTDRSTLQTHLRWLNLEWGIVFHFGKTTADFTFVQPPKKKLPADSGRPAD
jgi:GxxExxY protein